MSGIRVQYHPVPGQLLSGQPFTVRVPHPGTPGKRLGKDYFIRCDDLGYSIVSSTVWMRLQEAGRGGFSPLRFTYVNDVVDPPTQMVGRGRPPISDREMQRQVGDAVQELDPRNAYKDPRFKPSRPRFSIFKRRGDIAQP